MSEVKAFDKADYGLHPRALRALGLPRLRVPRRRGARARSTSSATSPSGSPGIAWTSGTLARRAEYEIHANWKLVAENFMEYYHLPWVHPSLVKVSPMDAHYRWQGTGKYVGVCTTPIAADTEDGGWLGLPAIDGLSEEDAVSARFVWLYPEHRAERDAEPRLPAARAPAAAGLTLETAYLLTNPESRARARESDVDALMTFWDEVNREDIAIVERVQDGIANPVYEGGRMCYRFEESVHRFQNMEIDRILGLWRVPEGDRVEGEQMFVSAKAQT